MKYSTDIFIFTFILLATMFLGCGYTTLKEDEPDPEYAIQDTLRYAADLIIDDATFNSVPPKSGESYPNPTPMTMPGYTEFSLTIENIGNMDYSQEFTVFWAVSSGHLPFSYYSKTARCNVLRNPIPLNSKIEFKFRDPENYDRMATFEFLIVTNPRIQQEAKHSIYTGLSQLPLSRELNYNNNSFICMNSE